MRKTLFLLAPGLIAASPVHAQSTDDVVVTANRTERPVAQVGQSVTVIDADEIAARQSVAVVDLLRTVPGVGFTRSGGIGTLASVNIRGADPQQTLLLVDGVKLDDPASTSGGFDFGNLLVGNIDRIEVVRGSQSVIWGSRAIGGVINVITRAPGDDPALNAQAEYGWRDTVNAVANASGKLGPVSASVGGQYLRTDAFSAFDGGTERDGYRNYGANAKLGVEVTDGLSLEARGRYSNGRVDLDGFAPPTFAFGDTGDYQTTRELSGYTGARLAVAGGRFVNRAGVAYTRTDRTNFDRTETATFDSRGTNRRFEYQGVLDLDVVDATIGAESERSRFRAESFGAFGSFSSARARINSVYGEATVTPVTGVALTAGVRHDDHSRFGGETTFAANTVLSPNGGRTRLRASYGEGFGAPSLFQLFGDYGNTRLVPERSKSVDVGLTQTLLDGAIEVGATGFHRDTENQIDFVSCFGITGGICANRPFGTYDNIRSTRAKGVEGTLVLRPIEPLRVAFAYTYLDATNRANGRQLARRPRETASVVADYRWGFGLSTGATIAHVGDSFDDAANARRLDGYVLVDLRASVPVTEAIELFGRVENLFDARYQTVFQYGTARRAAYGGVRLKL